MTVWAVFWNFDRYKTASVYLRARCYGTESDITGKITYFHSFENPEDWTYHYDYTFVPIDKEGFDNFYFYKYE